MGVVSPVAFASAASCAAAVPGDRVDALRAREVRHGVPVDREERHAVRVRGAELDAGRPLSGSKGPVESVGGELRDLLLGPALELAGSGMRPHP